MKNSVLTKQDIVAIIAGAKDGNLAIELADGRKVSVRRTVKYIRKNVSAKSGTFQLLETSTDKAVGITNFDGGTKLDANRELFVIGARLKVDTGTADPIAATFKNEPTAALKNGEVRIEQNGEKANFPVSVLYNPGTPAKVEDDFFAVPAIRIERQKTFKIEMETPAAIAATTCVNLEFDTIEVLYP